MSIPISRQLNDVLPFPVEKDSKVQLSELREKIAMHFKHPEVVLGLMGDETGTKRVGDLLLKLHRLVSVDSACRDVMTTGHLGKILSRVQFLESPEDYILIAWPNKVFDSQTQFERNLYFEEHRSFAFPGSISSSVKLRKMEARERQILQQFGL